MTAVLHRELNSTHVCFVTLWCEHSRIAWSVLILPLQLTAVLDQQEQIQFINPNSKGCKCMHIAKFCVLFLHRELNSIHVCFVTLWCEHSRIAWSVLILPLQLTAVLDQQEQIQFINPNSKGCKCMHIAKFCVLFLHRELNSIHVCFVTLWCEHSRIAWSVLILPLQLTAVLDQQEQIQFINPNSKGCKCKHIAKFCVLFLHRELNSTHVCFVTLWCEHSRIAWSVLILPLQLTAVLDQQEQIQFINPNSKGCKCIHIAKFCECTIFASRIK